MSIVDRAIEQFHQHIAVCVLCHDYPEGKAAPDCEEGQRLQQALEEML